MKVIIVKILNAFGLAPSNTLNIKDGQIQELMIAVENLTLQLQLEIKARTFLEETIDNNAKRMEKKEKKLADAVERYDILERTKADMNKNKKGTEKVESSAAKLKNWSSRVKQASGHKCDICEAKTNLTAHHLWDKSTHPTLMYQDENGICLCLKCHNGFHATFTSKTHCTPKMYLKYKTKAQSDAIFMASILNKENL